MKHLQLATILLALFFGSCSTDTTQEEEVLNAQFATSKSSGSCNTAFAKAEDNVSSCFINDGFRRWGWSIGPLTPGEYSFPIYAGAGQCDIEKGALAGTLNVNFDGVGNTVDVAYVANNGFEFTETHLYIGDTSYPMMKKGKKPKATVAPGKYPYQHANPVDRKNDEYTITDITENKIYIIAHAVTCEVPLDIIEDPVDETGDDIDIIGDPTEEDCVTCETGISNLVLKYNGFGPNELTIVRKEDGQVLFKEIVEPGQIIEINGNLADGSIGDASGKSLEGKDLCLTPFRPQ